MGDENWEKGREGQLGLVCKMKNKFFNKKRKAIVDVDLEIASLTEFLLQKTFLQPPRCILIQFSA